MLWEYLGKYKTHANFRIKDRVSATNDMSACMIRA